MSRAWVWGAMSVCAAVAACAQIGTDPSVPASIEAAPLAFPAIAIGDSLRDTLGVAQPVRALVRNIQGDVIADAPIRFLYVQAGRDTAVVVDSITGHVRVLEQPAAGPVQIAARFENALQVLIPLRVTRQPDTVFRTESVRIVGFVPDTGRKGADENSAAVTVRVQYRDANAALQNVGDWLVRFVVVQPANPANDTTLAAFLMNDNARPMSLDTTDAAGLASRRLRMRPDMLFPPGSPTSDTIVVEARLWKRGVPVPGAPVRIAVPVFSPSTRG